MLMSYQQQYQQQNQQQQVGAYPATLTTTDMQRIRESHASPRATRPSERIGGGGDASQELIYGSNNASDHDSGSDLHFQQHAYHYHHQQQSHHQQQQSHHHHQEHVRDPHHHHAPSSSGGARLYPSISGSYVSGSFEYDQQQPVVPVAQGSILYGSSHNQTSQHHATAYGSFSAVHPMSQDLSSSSSSSSWAPMSNNYASSHHHHHHPHEQQLKLEATPLPPVPTTAASTLGGLPELRADFHESDAMFAGASGGVIDDEYNDAKILHEVLQDNQQLPHHERHSLSVSSNPGFASHPHHQHQYNQHQPQFSTMPSYPHTSSSISMTDMLLPPPSVSSSDKPGMYMTLGSIRSASSSSSFTSVSNNANAFQIPPTSSSPSSSSYVSSSAGSPVSSLSSSGHHGASMKKKPASRICRMPGCSKGIRSRGLCKGHGGGRRCLTPGCEISDQGGGHCIAHGGGKRCTVPGCQKSAQSKGLCKLHGGARRCKVPNCAKNCQVKGLCRLHYSMYASNPSAVAMAPDTSPDADTSGGGGHLYMEDSSSQSFV